MIEDEVYVMLMMMRADEGYTPVEGCTAEELLACITADDYDACIAACSNEPGDEEPEEEKAGTLTVSLGKALEDGSQIPQAGTIKLASVKFNASETINVKAVSLKKVGLSAIPAGTKVWFEKDGVRISGRATFTSDGEAVVSFAPALAVKSNETVDLYAEITAGTVGATIQMQSTDIESTAERVSGSFKTPSLTFANYTVSAVTFTAGGAGGSALSTDNGIELGEFTLNGIAPSRDVIFQSVTLKQISTADLENLADFVLERNGEVVSNKYTVDGKNVTFKVNDRISKDTASVKYTIKAIANNVDTAADSYQFSLNKTTDLNVVEEETEFRATVTSTGTFGTYTIAGGEMTFARDTSLELSATYPAGSEVTMLKGTIKTNEAISLEDVTLTWNGTNALDTIFSTVYLKIGNSLLTYTPKNTDTNGTPILFEGSTTIDGTAQVKLYGTMKNTADGTVKFSPLQLSSFTTKEYVSNGVTVNSSIGNIAANTIDVANTTLNVTRTDGLGNTTLAAGSTDVTLYEVKLAATQGNGVKVTKAAFTVTAGASFVDNTTLTLYVDGVAKSSKTYKTSPVTFDGFNVTVDSSTTHTLKVVADFTENLTDAETIVVTLNNLTATDVLTSNTVNPSSKPAGATFTVSTASAEIASTDVNPDATFILAGSTGNNLIAFKVSAKNDSVRLFNLAFNGTNLDKASNYELVDASGTVIATASTSNATSLTFADIAGAPSIAKDKSAIYYVRATANTDTNSTISLTLTSEDSDVKASNGTTVSIKPTTPESCSDASYTTQATCEGAGETWTAEVPATVAGNTHKIAENSILVNKLDNPNKELSTSALRFSVTANGKDDVEITNLDVNVATNYIITNAKVVLYKNSISAANKVAESASAGTLTLPAFSTTIDAGNTVNYILVVEGAVVGANTPDWTVRLNDVTFDGVNAKDYSNLGELPISETK